MTQNQTADSVGMSRRELLKAGALAAAVAPAAAWRRASPGTAGTRRPAFRTPPRLAVPLLDTDPAALACDASGPGVIPPPGSVTTPHAVPA
jgi:hypothetical protein